MKVLRTATLLLASITLPGLALVGCGTSAGGASDTTSSAPAPAPSSSSAPAPTGPVTVTLLTHDSFALSEQLLTDFTARTGITIQITPVGDAGELVNRAVLSAGKPEGDVLFGVDNTLLSRAVDAGVFDPYVSPETAFVRSELTAAGNGIVTPIDDGDVCINIDDTWFAKNGVTPPASLSDLTRPEYADLLVTENPATSSPGLAFLLATIVKFGDAWPDYWRSLRDNGAIAVNGWEEAYTAEFSGAGNSGSHPLVVSYSTSPPAEIIYAADPAKASVNTSVLTDGCYRQIEFAGVLAGAAHPDAARAVVDWLLSPEVQADVTMSMFVYPARAGVTIPKVFTDNVTRPTNPLEMSTDEVAAHQKEWLDMWTDSFVS